MKTVGTFLLRTVRAMPGVGGMVNRQLETYGVPHNCGYALPLYFFFCLPPFGSLPDTLTAGHTPHFNTFSGWDDEG